MMIFSGTLFPYIAFNKKAHQIELECTCFEGALHNSFTRKENK